MRVFPPMIALVLAALAAGCGSVPGKPTVVVYASWDQLYSEPVFQEFERKTGIAVRAVYDTEASKVTGLVNRLIAERSNPQADVYWSGEVAQTILLKREGLLAPYASPVAEDIPAGFKDAEGYWTGFAARARVLVYNADLVRPEDAPTSILELTDAKWRNQLVIANPLFGTTATHMAALFEAMGERGAKDYLRALKSNGLRIADSNSRACEMVARGDAKVALTDTDDANARAVAGMPIAAVYPDQGSEGMGTLVIPNTVALVARAPHEKEAKALVDFLLSAEVEAALARSQAVQMPVRDGIARPEGVPDLASLRTMQIDFESVADHMAELRPFVQGEFLR